jgi:hypothetical protein
MKTLSSVIVPRREQVLISIMVNSHLSHFHHCHCRRHYYLPLHGYHHHHHQYSNKLILMGKVGKSLSLSPASTV